jgi:hypothetical protein
MAHSDASTEEIAALLEATDRASQSALDTAPPPSEANEAPFTTSDEDDVKEDDLPKNSKQAKKEILRLKELRKKVEKKGNKERIRIINAKIDKIRKQYGNF